MVVAAVVGVFHPGGRSVSASLCVVELPEYKGLHHAQADPGVPCHARGQGVAAGRCGVHRSSSEDQRGENLPNARFGKNIKNYTFS